MCPEHFGLKQRGAGLPVAIFIITVLALIVIGMAQLQESSGQAVSLQIQSQRAFLAADSGAQVGVAQVLDGASCGALTSPKSFSTAGLNGCSAQVSCDSVQADIEGNSALESVYTIVSAGQCGSGSDGARRVVEVRVR